MRNSGKVHAWIDFLMFSSLVGLIGYGLSLCIWAAPFVVFVEWFPPPWYVMPLALGLSALAGGCSGVVMMITTEVIKDAKSRMDERFL
jgi:hypothetical protein